MFLLFDEKIIRSRHTIPGIIDQKVIAALLRHDRVQGELPPAHPQRLEHLELLEATSKLL